VRTTLTAVEVGTGRCLDVLVVLCPQDEVRSLDAALRQLLPQAAPGIWLSGSPLSARATLLEAGVRTGCTLVLGGPGGDPPREPPSGAELHVVGGPDAGLVRRLPLGEVVVGSAAPAAVRLTDRDVAAAHLRLLVSPAGVVAAAMAPGVRLGPTALDAPVALGSTEQLAVGRSLLTVVSHEPPDAAVTASDDLGLDVNRPPRLQPAEPVTVVELPAAPPVTAARKLPVVPLLVPVVLGVVMAVVSSPLFLLFTLMSPLIAVSTWISDRRSGRAAAARATKDHAVALAGAEQRIAAAAGAETLRRRTDCPDPAVILLAAAGPGRRLWERRRGDGDALLLRVGTGPGRARAVRVSGTAAPAEPPALPDVPVVLALRELGVLGVAGPAASIRALARWLVCQAAVLHSPRDLSVVLLVDPAAAPAEPDWGWLRWLPHAAPYDGQDCTALVGDGIDGLSARVLELVALVTARTRAASDVRAQLEARSLPDVLAVLDGARGLRGLAGMAQVLRDGPRVGVHALCLDQQERSLPEECSAVVTSDGDALLSVRRSGGTPQHDVRADLVSAGWAEQVARALAPVRDVSDEQDAQLPASARLLEALSLDPPTAAAIVARWAAGARTTQAVVGVGTDGPFTLDLRRDGPHALVAGTTGSGKSEFLQTLVASLAVANRPDALTFLLVDYKGGAAFQDCARLPHTVGMVTDLDGHLVERALASLSAELKAREALLGQAGVKDIEDLWGRGVPLPRLVIVIDEFASLVEELPDFIRGLVGIAQRGRSLGVHLVLATQRPSGVVSPEIRANTNLRISLRVTDVAESTDVLDVPDAAAINRSTPGRAYARTGHATLHAFQSARVGGRRPGATLIAPAVVAVPLCWSALGLPPPLSDGPGPTPDRESTDLHALVEVLRSAAEGLELPAPRSPWLPALPAQLSLATVLALGADAGEDLSGSGAQPCAPTPVCALHPVPYGVQDLPSLQAQRPAVLDLEHGSHLLVAGAARSGRSTLLRTLAGSISMTCDPTEVHLYALDCGTGGLLPLASLPHCGAVVTRNQLERADRLLARLLTELARRQDLLSDGAYADVAEQRRASEPAERLPYLVLLLDRWEGFLGAFDEVDNGRLTEAVLRLLREGGAVGLRLVITGDRTVLVGKLASLVEDTLCLRLADRSDYALAGLSPRTVPEQVPNGRGFRGESGIEVQVAVLGDDASGAGQAAALEELAGRWSGRVSTQSRSPFRIDVLPTRVSRCNALALPSSAGQGPLEVLVGIGGDELTACTVDLALAGPGFTIAGPRRSGRSTALLSVARSLLAAGTELCVLAPRPSPLRGLSGAPGVLAVLPEAEPDTSILAGALNTAAGPLAVLVDDAELLHTSDIQHLLQQVLRDGRDLCHCLVVAGTAEDLVDAYRGFTFDARRSRSGLLLCPDTHLHGELLGVRLPRSAVFAGPPGRSLLVVGGQVGLVQVPTDSVA